MKTIKTKDYIKMINRKEIENRIKNLDNPQKYDGFDMSGYKRDEYGIENRNEENNRFCRYKNFKFLKEKFEDIFWDLDWGYFKLQTWKGRIWWGESCFKEDFNESNPTMMIKDFTSNTTSSIIEWLIENKPYPKKEIYRIIPRQERYEVCKRQKWNCNQCGEKLKFDKNSLWKGAVAHIDHIHPFSKKESYKNRAFNINETSNLQALCPNCNQTKSKKEIQ